MHQSKLFSAVAILFAIAVMTGCGKPPVTITRTTLSGQEITAAINPKELTDEEKIDLLREAAGKRHLRWRINCTRFYEDDPENFLAVAYDTEDNDQHNRWMVDAPNQGDAALVLYYSIQGDPTHPAEIPNEPPPSRTRAICPPAISDITSVDTEKHILEMTKQMNALP